MALGAETAKALAEARCRDAALLLENGACSSAYYLAGYAVELALKVLIAKQFVADVIPDKQFVLSVHSHKLAELLKLAGLQATFDESAKGSPALQANWLTVTQWSEASRYVIVEEYQAAELISAIIDPDTGVFQWLKSHW